MRLKSPNAAARVCVLVSFCVLVATAVMAAPASAALPEGRVYEMVSPPDKGPFFATGPLVGAGGERIAFFGTGAFSGSPTGLTSATGYLASRSPLGWQTSPLAPPPALARLVQLDAPNDFSPDLGLSVSVVDFAPEHSVSQSSQVVYVHSSDAPDAVESFVPLSPPFSTLKEPSVVFYEGASADFGRVIYKTKVALTGEDTTPGGVPRLYESTSSSPSSLKLVGVDDSGKAMSSCEVWLGELHTTAFHAVSADGSEVFFTACGGLFVRVNGSKTLQISGSALFQGASSDGSKVFFTEGGSLYEDEIEAGAVTAHVLVAEGVQGVTRISEDGSHVYFVSTGELTSEVNNPELGQKAHAGADNLYMYDTLTPETKFVAELCGGKETSGSVTGVGQCPGSESDQRLWQAEDVRPAQTSGCLEEEAATCESGRYLAFDTYAQLIHSGPEADKDTALDVYRYDARTGRIRRVSVGVEGHDHNGNEAFDATIAAPRFREGKLKEQYDLEDRAISENGTVVFATAEPLSVDAVNGLQNLYAWHEAGGEGSAGMISSGSSATSDEKPVIDVSGRDVFFQTTAGLVPQDSDGLSDVYDARIEGGFPAAPVQAGGCSGAACQGPPSVPALLAPPASATFSGLGNPPPPPSANPAVKRAVVKPLTNAQKLAGALRACKKKPKSQRKRCESQAHKRYAKKASESGRRA
jgi:hypothetical protein